MKNNAIINMRLKDLINLLDAKARVTIFISETEKVTANSVKVYELLADEHFNAYYGSYNVAGLIACGFTSTNILITKDKI